MKRRADSTMYLSTVHLVFCWLLSESICSDAQTIYPDGGRRVIPVVINKPSKAQPYNDGTVMAHIIGSAGMNFLYYFHLLGVSCENADPAFYKIIQKDFEFCLNKTGPLPPQLRNQSLGSIPKPCVDWKIHRPCYKNLADDYDECLVNRPGLVKKGTDALRFTHAYAKFICGNIADTEAHLLDRYTKHDLIVDGVFQCFPHLQDRIVNCVKRDKVSKTLCSKFYVVHACFGKYYNDDNCQDVQPIYYMDDLFRNMSASLSCPKDDDEWGKRPTHPTGEPYPTSPGWTHKPPRKGWSSREEHSVKENPWPGERGRPWSNNDRDPFIRDDQQTGHHQNRGWDSAERGSSYGGTRTKTHTTVDPHANRPYPDTSWSRPWVDPLDSKGTSWSPERNQIEIGTTRGHDHDIGFPATLNPTSPSQYITSRRVTSSFPKLDDDSYYFSTTPQGYGEGRQSALPLAGFAVTRRPHEAVETEEKIKYYRSSDSSVPISMTSTTSNHDPGFNFYSFE